MRGGFPEHHANPAIESEDFLRSYVATYLERDLRQLLQVSSLRDFERFVRAAALRTAQLLDRADLARDVGVSGSTAGAGLSALEASHQIVPLEPWFVNRTKALVKRPKLLPGVEPLSGRRRRRARVAVGDAGRVGGVGVTFGRRNLLSRARRHSLRIATERGTVGRA